MTVLFVLYYVLKLCIILKWVAISLNKPVCGDVLCAQVHKDNKNAEKAVDSSLLPMVLLKIDVEILTFIDNCNLPLFIMSVYTLRWK